MDGRPAPGIVVIAVLWALNNFESLKRSGTGLYFYIPKMQTPHEALIVETLFARLEELLGIPAGSIKIKILYEEGNGGRYLPAIAEAQVSEIRLCARPQRLQVAARNAVDRS